MEEETCYQPVEPTTPVPYPYGIAQIAPPPPPESFPQKKQRITWRHIFVLYTIIALIVIGEDIAYYILPFIHRSSEIAVPTVTPYTAQDIANAFLDHNLRVDEIGQGETVSSWMFEVSISPLALSSEQFQDNLACNGPCASSPLRYGIWVYATPSDAQTVYQAVVQDLPNLLVSYPAQYQWRWYPATYTDNGRVTSYNVQTHRRCLLLGADSTSPYTNVIRQNCT